MAYAIRYNSPTHQGMLVEMGGSLLAKLVKAQREADELRDAYWDTPDESRHAMTLPPETFPYYEAVHASRAHQWVKSDWPHETLLYVEEGRVRRAA